MTRRFRVVFYQTKRTAEKNYRCFSRCCRAVMTAFAAMSGVGLFLMISFNVFSFNSVIFCNVCKNSFWSADL